MSCRICLEDDSREVLFRPCLCDGSMRLVHRSCLDRWRRASVNPRSRQQCDLCRYSYEIHRTRLGELLRSSRVRIAVTAFLCLVFTILVGFVVHSLLGSYIQLPEWTYQKIHWRPPEILKHAGFDVIMTGMLVLSCISFMIHFAEYSRARHNEPDDQRVRRLGMFGLWLISMSSKGFSRFAFVLGLCVAYQKIYMIVELRFTIAAQVFGERILDIHESD